MKTDRKIIRWRHRNPLMTGSAIAKRVGCNRQYVSHILKKAGLHNRQGSYKSKVTYCKKCGIPTQQRLQFCSIDCRQAWYWIEVQCRLCNKSFMMVRSHVVQRYQRGFKNIFCSKKCYRLAQTDKLVGENGAKRRTYRQMGTESSSPVEGDIRSWDGSGRHSSRA